MAKQVIVLGKQSAGGQDVYNILLWIPITNSASQKPSVNGSAWGKASAAENAAIQSGAVVELPQSLSLPAGLDSVNVLAVQAVLQQAWSVTNSQYNGIGPNEYNGVAYDPSANGWQQY